MVYVFVEVEYARRRGELKNKTTWRHTGVEQFYVHIDTEAAAHYMAKTNNNSIEYSQAS